MTRPAEAWVVASRLGVKNASQRPSNHSSLALLDPKLWLPYVSETRVSPPPGEFHLAPMPSSVKRLRSLACQSSRAKPVHCEAVRGAGPSSGVSGVPKRQLELDPFNVPPNVSNMQE